MWPFLPSQKYPWIPTYYLFTSLAFVIAIFWGVKRAQNKGLNPQVILDLALVIMAGAFLGGRFFHVFLEEPHYYALHPMDAFKFWIGGFVFYGGFWGALISILVYKKFRDFDFLTYADLLAPVIAFGYGVGRLGCFSAGCCFGIQSSMPWAVIFPPWSQATPYTPLHPTQLYCTVWEWSVVAILLALEKKPRRSGQIFGIWLMAHGLGRAIIEQFRDDFRGQNVFNLSISTWISFIIIGTGAWLVFGRKK